MMRDDLLFQTIQTLQLQHSTWLDVGAGTGSVSLKLKELLSPPYFRCVDVLGTRHNARHKLTVENFNGHSFPDMGDQCVSFTLFNFVLHHAANNTEPLLREAFRVSSRAVILQEDLNDRSYRIGKVLHDHDPNGIFRSQEEWFYLLSLLAPRDWKIVIHPHLEPAEDASFHAPRALFIIAHPSVYPRGTT